MGRSSAALLSIVLLLSPFTHAAPLNSPDGRIALLFDIKGLDGASGCPVYSVEANGQPLIRNARLGFELTDGTRITDRFRLESAGSLSADTFWESVYGERSRVRERYNQLTLTLRRESPPVETLNLIFRCYDAGVAFRYEIPASAAGRTLHIKRELSTFQFTADHDAWCTTSAQGVYARKKLSQMGHGVERPLTIRVNESLYAAIGEAALVNYARMKLAAGSAPFEVVSELSGPVEASLPLVTPWRFVMIASSPGKLLENNDLVLNLNEPCAIKDPSWIRPGKVIREVTLTTEGGKACVDFAAANGLQYVEYDAGWYGQEDSDESDATTIDVDPKRSAGPLDLQEVIRYAGERGIGIILYVNRRALERQLDEILPLYRSWGVKGVKYGFVQVGSCRWTGWLHEAVRKAADHRLMVDIHDEYRPTGYSRTYPNLMTQEGIRGDEARPPAEQTLTILFTRMLAGAGDNTICCFERRVDELWSHAYQLAKAVCIYSPWQFLYWYDRPKRAPGGKGGAGGQASVISEVPELEFFKHLPTVWDDTRVLNGRIGEYAVIARRSGSDWFIGAMNGNEPHTFDVRLDFLDKGKTYMLTLYTDDPKLDTPTRVNVERRSANAETTLSIPMPARGGYAARLVPMAE